jgi:hypothetical protein
MNKLRTALSAFVFRTTRGRRGALMLYSGVVTLVLAGLAAVIAARANEYGGHVDALALADVFCIFLLGTALFVIAPAMVAAQVGEERRSGTLDLLRTAPLSPTMLAFGFIGGAPSALYLLSTGPLALHVVAGLLGHYPLSVLPESLVVLGLGSLTLMLLAMLASLTITREGGGGATPMLVAGGLGIAAIIASSLASDTPTAAWAFMHPAGALSEIYARFSGPYASAFTNDWRMAHLRESPTWAWLQIEPAFAAVVYAIGALLLLVAARRALAGDPPARFTKWEAISIFALACVSLLVPLRATTGLDTIHVGELAVVSMFLIGPYLVSVVGATPSAVAYGAGRERPMSERGSPLLAAALMLLVYAALGIIIIGPHAWLEFQTETLAAPAIFVALTVPVYSLFASTRLTTPGGRLAFWAMLTIHFVLQAPAWVWLAEKGLGGSSVESLLAELGAAFGVILPAVIVWRQRVGDRELVA